MNKKSRTQKSLIREARYLKSIGLRDDEIEYLMWSKMKAASRFR